MEIGFKDKKAPAGDAGAGGGVVVLGADPAPGGIVNIKLCFFG